MSRLADSMIREFLASQNWDALNKAHKFLKDQDEREWWSRTIEIIREQEREKLIAEMENEKL